MKKIFNQQLYVSFFLTVALAFTGAVLWAQDSSNAVTSTTTTTTAQAFNIQPWMWVVGGAIVLIIIIALLRGGAKEKVVITKES